MFRSQLEDRNGIPILRISAADCGACISLQGGQVLEWQQRGAESVLWQNEAASYEPGHAIRQGIPICWPWFGDIDRNMPAVAGRYLSLPEHPAHGLVRQRIWELVGVDCRRSHAVASLQCDLEELALRARLRVQVSAERLSLELESCSTGASKSPVSLALHTYFSVSDVSAVELPDLVGREFIDCLDDWQLKPQLKPPMISAETDRIYINVPRHMRVVDPGWQRTLHIESENSRSAILWNPWKAKASRLSQFDNAAYTRMLCLETGRVLDNYLELPPAGSETVRLEIYQSRN